MAEFCFNTIDLTDHGNQLLWLLYASPTPDGIIRILPVPSTMDVLIVGAGSIGQKEILELRDHPAVRIIGVVDEDETQLAAVSSTVPKTYNELPEALGDTNPDLVRIATPPQTHHELAMIALEADCDVYIEKIMTLDSGRAREIIETAEEYGKSVYVRRNGFYTPVYYKAWNEVDRLGEPRYVHWIEPVGEYSDWNRSKRAWLRDLPGGIVSEHLPHALYTVRWILQAEPAVEDVFYDSEELHVSLTAGDKRARISYIRPSDYPMILDVVGSKGTIRIDHSTMRIHKPRGFESARSVEWRTARANVHDLFGSVKNLLRLSQQYVRRELNLAADPFYSQSDNYRQFTDIANDGEPSGGFRIDGEEGLRNVRLFEEIWDRAEANYSDSWKETTDLR